MRVEGQSGSARQSGKARFDGAKVLGQKRQVDAWDETQAGVVMEEEFCLRREGDDSSPRR